MQLSPHGLTGRECNDVACQKGCIELEMGDGGTLGGDFVSWTWRAFKNKMCICHIFTLIELYVITLQLILLFRQRSCAVSGPCSDVEMASMACNVKINFIFLTCVFLVVQKKGKVH